MRNPGAEYDVALREMSKRLPNTVKAKELLQKAYRRGDARAGYALGTWYLYGAYVKEDKRKGMQLIGEAARQGVADAMFDMAVSYETGDGVRKSTRRALEYYLRAALAGDMSAPYEVGRCYYYGIGCERDRHIAWIWLERSKDEKKVSSGGTQKRAPVRRRPERRSGGS